MLVFPSNLLLFKLSIVQVGVHLLFVGVFPHHRAEFTGVNDAAIKEINHAWYISLLVVDGGGSGYGIFG